MLTYTELIELERGVRARRVLSVYIDGTNADPAQKHVWTVLVDQALREIRHWLAGSSHNEREEFEQCVSRLAIELEKFDGNIRAPGWAAFITPERVIEASPLPVSVPTRVIWSNGICVAPYMRVHKEARPVILALADATRTDLYRYQNGELKAIETVRAHHVVAPPAHMGKQPRVGFHSGTRGSTGRDSAQQSLQEGTNRMLRDVEKTIIRFAGADGWIVAGGIPKISEQLTDRLEKLAPGRVLNLQSLDIHSSEAQLADGARFAAHTLRSSMELSRVGAIIDHESAKGLGTLGLAATGEALERGCVRELYLTGRFLNQHPAATEQAVRSAIDQDAIVEQVAGDAEVQLDAHGGIAARLRYRLSPNLYSGESEVVTAGGRDDASQF